MQRDPAIEQVAAVSMKPAYYHDVSHHALEIRALFASHWIFVGMTFELNGLRHLGLNVGATELVLQRDKSGRPRAFLNVCAHRHAQLCAPGLHEGALRCPYHGWVYDREGVPVGIPQPHAFPAVVSAPQEHRLTEFACDTAGEFVFVRLSAQGPSLKQYLGPEHDFLCRASVGMDSVLDEFRQDVRANWKVVIENSLEGYHVPAVHNQTFMQVAGMASTADGPPPRDDLDHPLHSSMVHAVEPGWLARFERSVEPRLGRWPSRCSHYTHRHIFPNLTITSFMGYSFHVQVFQPTAAELTTVHSRTLGVSFQGQQEMGRRMLQRMHDDNRAFTRQVFDEDAAICARVQAGVRQARRPAVLALGLEGRVAHFQRAYVTQMAAELPAA